jgi:tetratricopeptide (TPR) repeat protein
VHLSTITKFLVCILLWGIFSVSAAPLNEDPLHDKGVKTAREGNHREGLAILQSILNKDPNNYAVRRDVVIIATWAGDCDLALKNYKHIENTPQQESYVLVPVSDCLNAQNRRADAIALLEKGIAQWPKDEELKEKLTELEAERDIDTAPAVSVSLSTDSSDQGNLEWLFETRYSQQISKDTRAYARFLAVRADDPEFATGDLNRLGIGAIYHLNFQWAFDAEFSTDVKQSGDEGITGTVLYQPYYLWQLGLQHATFAEDVPLRAKAVGTTSDRTSAFVDFRTEDYRWTWSAGANQYDFSDNNNRKSFYTSGSYAYSLKPKLEHRVVLDLSRSKNTLPSTNTVYFNPSLDSTINLTHKTSLVYDSRFERHVDHFFVFIGSYWQKDYSSNPIYGVGLQQEYNFTDYDYFTWGAGVDSRVYDGNREQQLSVYVSYEHKF